MVTEYGKSALARPCGQLATRRSVEVSDAAQLNALPGESAGRRGVMERRVRRPPRHRVIGVVQLDDQRLARVHGREVPPAVPGTVSEDTGRGRRAGLVESGGVESGGATTARQRALDLLGSRQGRDAE